MEPIENSFLTQMELDRWIKSGETSLPVYEVIPANEPGSGRNSIGSSYC
ncbi:hypothetical protein [Flexibacterium corallicola]|nr:hypothetical protein [Pseudovibrio sp. M1P-2-3]